MTIDQNNRIRILKRFGLSNENLIARGTEAEAYALGESEVLKIYTDLQRFQKLKILQTFYNSIDARQCGFQIPKILEIIVEGDMLATRENRIPGVSLESLLPSLDGSLLDQAESLYLKAVCALQEMRLDSPPKYYSLFDETNESSIGIRPWNEFYVGLVKSKITEVEVFLGGIVPNFYEKTQKLLKCFELESKGKISVVHGDLFPGNLMVKNDLSSITGIIDFGSFTLFGDHMLDIAGAFGYYKMYEKDRILVRERILPKFLEIVPPSEKGRFFRYLCANAILTSNLYVTEPDPSRLLKNV